MPMLKTVMKGGLAALAVAVMTAGAYAWPASATTTLNVRSGPGTQFRVVDVLQRNEPVEVDYCRGSWCFIQSRDGQGWASSSYLARYQAPQPPQWQQPPNWQRPPQQPPHWQRPPQQPPHWNQPRPPQWGNPGWGSNPGWGNPGWGNDWNRPNNNSQVCYDGPNGAFCFG